MSSKINWSILSHISKISEKFITEFVDKFDKNMLVLFMSKTNVVREFIRKFR